MTKPPPYLAIATAAAITLALSVVIVLDLFSIQGQSEGMGAYSGGISEILLVILAVGLAVSILTVFFVRRKRT
jgi:hypothetical protein